MNSLSGPIKIIGLKLKFFFFLGGGGNTLHVYPANINWFDVTKASTVYLMYVHMYAI